MASLAEEGKLTMRPSTIEDSAKKKHPDFRVLLRIYANTNDLDGKSTKGFLELTEGDPRIVNRYYDQGEGIAGWEFANWPQLNTEDRIKEWQQTAFLNATLWLQDKQPGLFQQFRESGNKVDVCVAGYTGPIPSGLTRQLSRLSLELYVLSLAETSN